MGGGREEKDRCHCCCCNDKKIFGTIAIQALVMLNIAAAAAVVVRIMCGGVYRYVVGGHGERQDTG